MNCLQIVLLHTHTCFCFLFPVPSPCLTVLPSLVWNHDLWPKTWTQIYIEKVLYPCGTQIWYQCSKCGMILTKAYKWLSSSVHFQPKKCWYFSYFSVKTYGCWYSFEMPCLDASNRYLQQVFMEKKEKHLSGYPFHPLPHCRLDRLPHTIHWKSPISSLGMSGNVIEIFLVKNG